MKDQHRDSSQRNTFLEREVVASVTECTGLIPSLTDTDPDAEIHEAVLYGIHPPKKRDGIPEEEKPDTKGKRDTE